MLKKSIAALEAQARAKLDEIRARFEHAGEKGAAVETLFRELLLEYLPRRLEIGRGEIIDTKGRRSRQTDLVIVNEDHPLTFTPDQPGLFFIEGVIAAGEVKTTITSSELDDALKNSVQFKQLEVYPGRGTRAHTNPSDLERFYKRRLWFLIAFSSQLSLSGIRNNIETFLKANEIENNRLLDAVFVLDRGWVINFGDGQGTFGYETPEGTIAEGFVEKDSVSVLFDLLAWLSCVMPREVRFESILTRYILPEEKRSKLLEPSTGTI